MRLVDYYPVIDVTRYSSKEEKTPADHEKKMCKLCLFILIIVSRENSRGVIANVMA